VHLEIDKYWRNDSLIHRMDPRLRVVMVVILTAALLLLRSAWAVAAGLAFCLVLVRIMRIPWRAIALRLSAVAIILSPLAVLFPLVAPSGEKIEAVLTAIAIMSRGGSLALLAFPLFNASRFHVTMAAFRALHVPKPAVSVLMLAYRVLFIFFEDKRRMQIAAATRGWRGGSFGRTLALVGRYVGSLVVRSVVRTERMWHAMKSRAFQGEYPLLVEFRIGLRDVAVFVLFSGLAVGLAVLDRLMPWGLML